MYEFVKISNCANFNIACTMYIVAKSHTAAAGIPFHIIFLGKTHRTSQNTPLCSCRIKFAADCRIDRNELLHRIWKIMGPFDTCTCESSYT